MRVRALWPEVPLRVPVGKSARRCQSANRSTSSLGRSRMPRAAIACPPASAKPNGPPTRSPIAANRRWIDGVPPSATTPRTGVRRRVGGTGSPTVDAPAEAVPDPATGEQGLAHPATVPGPRGSLPRAGRQESSLCARRSCDAQVARHHASRPRKASPVANRQTTASGTTGSRRSTHYPTGQPKPAGDGAWGASTTYRRRLPLCLAAP
jgi:hypothetical protein